MATSITVLARKVQARHDFVVRTSPFGPAKPKDRTPTPKQQAQIDKIESIKARVVFEAMAKKKKG